MEKEFLKIVLSAETDNAEANRKMAAFVKFHSVVEGLPERDLEVLKHAESFENKIRNDARNTARSDVEKIRSAMVTAARSDSLSEKEEIYRSIVYLYQNVIWGTNDTGVEGQRLVKQASDFLDDLESR
jgi:hypothetical protein